jgi:hypothetical protein
MVSGFLLQGPRIVARRLRPVGPAATTAATGALANAAPHLGALRGSAFRQYRRFIDTIDPPGPHGRATEVSSLSSAARRFFEHPRPPVQLGVLGVLGAVRAVRGDFRRSDAAVALGALAAQPFVEWGIHRYLLHAPPTGRFGKLAYRTVGWGHTQHHEDPPNLDSMFMRSQDILGAAAVGLAVGAVGSPRVATGMFCVGAAVLAYDWTHFLIHTSYRPRSAFYRQIWRSHRLHHYRNERYWLGVTSPVADLVLRTSPARDDVPVSTHAAHPESHRQGRTPFPGVDAPAPDAPAGDAPA